MTQVAERERIVLGKIWRAVANYSAHKGMSPLGVTIEVVAESSAGIDGWAEAQIDRNGGDLNGVKFAFGEDAP